MVICFNTNHSAQELRAQGACPGDENLAGEPERSEPKTERESGVVGRCFFKVMFCLVVCWMMFFKVCFVVLALLVNFIFWALLKGLLGICLSTSK